MHQSHQQALNEQNACGHEDDRICLPFLMSFRNAESYTLYVFILPVNGDNINTRFFSGPLKKSGISTRYGVYGVRYKVDKLNC